MPGEAYHASEKLSINGISKHSYYHIKCDKTLTTDGRDHLELGRAVEKYFRGGLKWEWIEQIDGRLRVGTTGGFQQLQSTCPVSVSVVRPL